MCCLALGPLLGPETWSSGVHVGRFGAIRARRCSSRAEHEFLTIAEAAQRVRCCERTLRRAIDSGALRAGRIRAVDGKGGGFRIRPADLETWMYGDGP
jgi:excisionase family DNA binding protein